MIIITGSSDYSPYISSDESASPRYKDLKYAVQSHNAPKSPMKKFYESCGFEVSWDFDSRYHWDELLLDGKMVLQVEQGITIKQFLKAVDDILEDNDEKILFFMASNLKGQKLNDILIKHFKQL